MVKVDIQTKVIVTSLSFKNQLMLVRYNIDKLFLQIHFTSRPSNIKKWMTTIIVV